MPTVRVYQKKVLRLDLLNFKQSQMYSIGTAGVTAVKARLARAQGPTDAAAKPLKRGYAIWKTRQGKGNRRNLALTGDMLRNLQVRTVSDRLAKASLSTRKDRAKALANMGIEPWVVFSPKNREAVRATTQKELQALKDRLVIEKALGGRQV